MAYAFCTDKCLFEVTVLLHQTKKTFHEKVSFKSIEKYDFHVPPETVKAKFKMRPACEGEIFLSIKAKEVAVMTTLVRIRMKAETQLYTMAR